MLTLAIITAVAALIVAAPALKSQISGIAAWFRKRRQAKADARASAQALADKVNQLEHRLRNVEQQEGRWKRRPRPGN